jgi:hypothetical protein
MIAYRDTRSLLFCCLLGLSLVFASQPSRGQGPGGRVNVTTWHQDTPPICTGCAYRTGQNLAENKITYSNISKSTFGQLCSASLDGQVYGEPLVVTNVLFSGQTQAKAVVYVVTQNGSVYAFDGTPSTSGTCTKLNGPVPLFPAGSGETAVNCANVGGMECQTIAPNVGLLGTPVISANTSGSTTTGTIYIVAESQFVSGSSVTFYHRLWALDITSLSLSGVTPIQISPPGTTACPSDTLFSQKHIQRPALLLGGDGYLYVAFSMMDGIRNPYPNGMIFAYNTGNLSAAPLCLATSQGLTLKDGAGIWQGSAGPAYGPDGGGTNYTYFTTANGVFDLNQAGSNAGDSFIKMSNSGSALSIADYFTPIDQKFRSDSTCTPGGGDVDFGSGGPMLIPPSENTDHPYLGVSGDKEGGIWFMNLASPGEYGNTGTTCSGTGSNANVQTHSINGSYPIHTNPAFWEASSAINYLFIGSQGNGGVNTSGELLRYQICNSGPPISPTSPCTTAFLYATDGGQQVTFNYGTTPSVSAASTAETDAIVWAIWADGDVVPNTQTIQFTFNGKVITDNPSNSGKLYAFDALTMNRLYSSDDCMVENWFVDRINPATKFSIPTVANGYVYLGTMGPRCQDPNSGLSGLSDSAGCYNSGTFYIFGTLSPSRGACH